MFAVDKFGISPSEPLLITVSCGEGSSPTGTMILSPNCICYHAPADARGPERKVVVLLQEVTAMERKSVLFSNSINVYTRHHKYTFSGSTVTPNLFATLEEAWQNKLSRTSAAFLPDKPWGMVRPRDRLLALSSNSAAQPLQAGNKALQRDDMGFPIEAENTLLYMGMEARLKHQADAAFEEWWRFLRESSLELEIRKRSTRFRDLIRRGIPDTQRGELWWKLPDVAAKMRSSPQTYADYLSQRDKSTAWRDIEKDACRTYPEHAFFQSEAGTELLRRILVAYSLRNPSLGYCQGMNFLAGFLLLWLQEEQAFWMLVYLVEDVLLDYFGRSMIGSLVDTKVFLDLLQRSLPKLFSRLQSQGFPFSAITTNWLCCVFVNFLPKKVALRVWDCVFAEGVHVMFLVAIAIFMLSEEALLAEQESFQVMEALRRTCASLYDADQLLRVAFDTIGARLPQLDKQLHSMRFECWIASENELCEVAAKARKTSPQRGTTPH
jgi:hypothetical protein